MILFLFLFGVQVVLSNTTLVKNYKVVKYNFTF